MVSPMIQRNKQKMDRGKDDKSGGILVYVDNLVRKFHIVKSLPDSQRWDPRVALQIEADQ